MRNNPQEIDLYKTLTSVHPGTSPQSRNRSINRAQRNMIAREARVIELRFTGNYGT